MKVLHVTNLFPEKGNISYGIFVKEQINSLRVLGIDCEVIFINAAKNGKFEYFKKIFEIARRSKHVDIIHCHHTYSAFFTLFFARVNKPVVTSFLGPSGREGKSTYFYAVKRYLYKYAKKHSELSIIKNSSISDPDYSDSEVCIPNGVDIDFFREISTSESLEQLGLPNKKYVIFCSSTDLYRREKRYDLFLETIKIIKSKYDSDVAELAVENEERDRMPFLFNASAVHLLTSDHEGSPNSVKEALACNIPVVSRDVGNVKWMLDSVEGCYVCDTEDPNVLAELTMKAMSCKRVKGRERLGDLKLDMKSVAEQIKEIYVRVLS